MAEGEREPQRGCYARIDQLINYQSTELRLAPPEISATLFREWVTT